jgi:hypothetical protein
MMDSSLKLVIYFLQLKEVDFDILPSTSRKKPQFSGLLCCKFFNGLDF